MSKATDTARDLRDQITGKWQAIAKKRQAIADAQTEIAHLEREARWAEGEERRRRLTAYAEQARQLAESAAATSADITSAAQAVTDSIRHLIATVEAHNIALGDVRKKITAEGVSNSFTPPSPADGGVGVNGTHVITGEHHIIPLNTRTLVSSAVDAGHQPNTIPTIPAMIVHRPLATGENVRFWEHPNGNTFIADHQLHECTEISRAEFLARQWKINLSSVPQELLDDLGATDRARVAAQVLDELDDDERNKYVEQLLPARKEATK